MNDIGNTVVYVNGTVRSYTGLQENILIDDITIGRANVTVNVTVVYESDGGMCSFGDTKLIRGQLVVSWLCLLMHVCSPSYYTMQVCMYKHCTFCTPTAEL